jgi:Lon protease-like protein
MSGTSNSNPNAPLPLFPLSNVVLFPTLAAPLFVFEPRYRQMTADALERDGMIGMIAVVPEPDLDMRGDPPVFQIGCAGHIERSELRPDGTYNILLAATDRFRILRELDPSEGRLYRSAIVEPLAEPAPPRAANELAPLRREIVEQLEAFTRHSTEHGQQQLDLDQLAGIDDVRLVNALAQSLDFEIRDKQRLLEAGGVVERYGLLAELIRFRRAETEASSLPGSGVRQ